METSEFCARPLTRQDAEALIGVLAVLEGEISAQHVDEQAIEHFRRRLTDDGLLGAGREGDDLAAVLEALSRRVRFALGE